MFFSKIAEEVNGLMVNIQTKRRIELLDAFAEVATGAFDSHKYWDTSEPENRRAALNFYNSRLYWLDGRDKRELLEAWGAACDDPRDVKVLFNTVKSLKEKYSVIMPFED